MAQIISPSEQDAETWNPALRPDSSIHHPEPVASTDALSDLLAADNAKQAPTSDVKSPLSDDSFSAWDMPIEGNQMPSIDTAVESTTENAPATLDNNPKVNGTTDAVPAEASTSDESQDPFAQGAEPSQPQPDQPPAPLVEAALAVDANEPTLAPTSDNTEPEQPQLQPDVPAVFPPQITETREVVEPTTTAGPPAEPESLAIDNNPVQPQGDEPSVAVESTFEPVEPVATGTETNAEIEIPTANEEPAEQPFQTESTTVESVFNTDSQEDPAASFFDDIEGVQDRADQTPGPWDALDDKDTGAQPVVETPTQAAESAPLAVETTLEDEPTEDDDAWGHNAPIDVDSDGDDFFNQLKTQTKPIFGPPETESRYEEGVPLLDEPYSPFSPAQEKIQETPQQTSVDNLFDKDDEDAEGFFSSAQKPEPSVPRSLHITRKSTSQVMDSSIGFHIDSPVSDISAAAQLDSVLNAASSDSTAPQVQTEGGEPSEEDLAARWEAELSDMGEDDIAARWEAALSDDDEDMLLGDDVQPPTGQQTAPQAAVASLTNAGPTGLNSPFQTPQSQAQPRPIPGVYTPHQPTTGDLVSGHPLPGAPPQTNSYFSQQPSNPVATRGESYAEQSKQGYKSPYDLPDDLSRPRRPVATHKPVPPKVENMPPPSSIGVQQHAAPPPMPSAPSAMAPPTTTPAAPPPAPKNFYEELPLPAPRSRPASSGRYTSGPVAAGPGPTVQPPMPPPQHANIMAPPPAPPANIPAAQSSLQLPEPVDPYSSTLASSAPAGPSAASRYSPKPPGLNPSAKPPSLPRYSPAPPPSAPAGGRNRYASQPLSVPGQQTSLPFQPRTSSPLAYHEKVSYQPEVTQQHHMPPPSLQPSVDLSPLVSVQASIKDRLAPHQAPPTSRYAPAEYLNEFANRVAPSPTQTQAPPLPSPTYAPAVSAPAAAGPTSPQAVDSQFAAPRRSQTQSPGQQVTSPRSYVPSIEPPLPRPASVHGSSSPTKTSNPYAPAQPSIASRARAMSQHLAFITPVDGQEQDTLQRWKGAPIFKFGFGGAVVSCFPKHIPRYSAGQTAPMIKPSPGEPKFSQLNQWLPPTDTIVQHPGPLKTKAKKKDVLAWISSKVAAFENEVSPDFDHSDPDAQKRHDEKILLWKVAKILVENDGVLEGSPAVEQSLRQAIFPNLQSQNSENSYGGTFANSGSLRALNNPLQSDSVDPRWMEDLRNDLFLGEREKAVWGAVDRRLWGHAMIVASTMDKSVWKQVVQEFVRREIKSTAANSESLSALYEIFAGNVEESIDELVPPSARAGHHLISKADGQGASKNALDGLDSWRDTLGLVLSNRSPEDHQALLALGRLLASYGRIEAAHICFMFSRGAVFGGADDPHANIVLLGADHQRHPCTLLDEDSFLLTEIYEYATSVLASSPIANLPHLLSFKLLHAKQLADRGRKSEAQNYCDGVAASLKATTRPSPYHHQYLFIEVDELSARLRQTTTDGGSSWISKPSMEKVSGSVWARFNSFVAGDENDPASAGSGKAGEVPDVGPFANIAGTPTVSRSPSVSDLYGSYPGAGAQPIPAGGPSRYMPSSNPYAPNGSPEQPRGRSSMDSQRSASYGGISYGQRRSSQDISSPSADTQTFAGAIYGSPGAATGYQPTPPQSSYMPLAPVEETSATQSPADSAPPPQSTLNGLFYQPQGQESANQSQSPYYQGPPGMPQPESNGYLPPATSSNSYEPPSYAPVMSSAPEEIQDPAEEEAPKPKKSFMDDEDDGDLAAQAAALKKAENDRKADEAFRKAAEEDAKKDQQGPKKGWFGGWFGGAKKEAEQSGGGGGGGGPIRAKLGEENSFYYDKDLKKWVNKKDPGSAEPVRATPPPPRSSAPPSRNASSGSMPPPPMPPMPFASGSRPTSSSSDMPPSLSSSPAFSSLGVPPPMGPYGGSLPRSVSTGAAHPTPPGSSSGPPPRPSSSLTHASSIDDLIGAPQARKGNTVKGKKKGRYVDVMAQ
ncbi:hypothetical protein N7509_013396 [Penicillium cosmopolitanum]|uniref:Protein transport protein sec16 n=1 Tax=Penicillium cosmopolitanum TaxID=1131564 RepID=A0A9W9VEG5_9EURO|nr:uncharacterized protein N7509_013396 [Penicillium cosmopolitanum]KAJ5376510.1 hypothetical protein N7509_013396 [Penicillium cosmopolitanum]